MGAPKTSGGAKVKWYDKYVEDMPSHEGQCFAITGTSSGTGFFAAKALVMKGATVFCLNRPSERADESLEVLKKNCSGSGSATQVDCDLQDFASVKAAAAAVHELLNGRGLNALLNNAGVAFLPFKATKDGFDREVQTNHLSHFLLTSLLLPDLTEAGNARVVNHSSLARKGPTLSKVFFEKLPEAGLPEGLTDDGKGKENKYHQSKLANVLFTTALKEKLQQKQSSIKSLVAHPGMSSTSILEKTVKATDDPKSLGHLKYFPGMIRRMGQSPQDGSLPLLAAAVSSDAESGDFYVPGARSMMSWMIGEGVNGPPVKGSWSKIGKREPECVDAESAQILWEVSEKAIGQSFF